MGWRFHRSFKTGPIRWNLSRRGVGASWGIPGFRVGMSADGKRYLSIGIPGTGLYYQHYFGRTRSGRASVNPNPYPVPVPVPFSGGSSLPPPANTSVSSPIIVSRQPHRARLIAKRLGLGTGEEFDLADRAIVGRACVPSTHVDVDLSSLPEAPCISAEHAEIRYDVGTGWVIRDLGSQNGTFVRCRGVAKFHRVIGDNVLRDGDEVAFGNARFKFQTT